MSRFRGPVPGAFSLFHSFESPLPELPALLHVNEAVCTPDHVLSAHAHPTLEICYFLAGHAEWSSGGERFRLGPGDFYVSRPGEAHSGVPDRRDPNHNFAVGFDPARLPLARLASTRRTQEDDEARSPFADVGLTPSHFTVAFKREVGVTPLEYLTTLRIDEAARRLRSGNEAVTGIAMDLGFSSSQYFSLVFKQRKGCTPSEWRGR